MKDYGRNKVVLEYSKPLNCWIICGCYWEY